MIRCSTWSSTSIAVQSRVIAKARKDSGKRETFMIRLKRVYEPASEQDGKRLLVERLWPRGVKKTSARLDGWLKEVSPSSALRTWFGHDATKWSAFQDRYFKELDGKPEAW